MMSYDTGSTCKRFLRSCCVEFAGLLLMYECVHLIFWISSEKSSNFGTSRTKRMNVVQSSKDSTSPMSETCKIRAGQVKFQDRKPDWACKIVESKVKEILGKTNQNSFL